jgi:hypothetical protein
MASSTRDPSSNMPQIEKKSQSHEQSLIMFGCANILTPMSPSCAIRPSNSKTFATSPISFKRYDSTSAAL